MWGIRQSCVFSFPSWCWLKRLGISVTVAFVWMNCFQYFRKYVFKGPSWTIYSWYCFFVLYCIFLHFNISFEKIHYIFLPLCGVKTKIPLTVLNCHAILIDNVCRLLLKSMLPTMFIQLCVTFKHIYLASYVGVKELAAKVNAAVLWWTYIMSKTSLKLLEFRLRKNVWTL